MSLPYHESKLRGLFFFCSRQKYSTQMSLLLLFEHIFQIMYIVLLPEVGTNTVSLVFKGL
jgi:hypothetical protein